jgi:hypothetical protein
MKPSSDIALTPDHLAGSGTGIAHTVPPKIWEVSPDPFRRVSGRAIAVIKRATDTTRKGSFGA